MKVLKVTLSTVGTLFFAGCMFFSFIGGAPGDLEGLRRYTLWAAGFSILLPLFTCLCVNYILRLQKRIEDLENNAGNKGTK